MATVKHIVVTALQPRPDHNFPKCLEPNETQCLTDILGQDRLALVAAAVQILFALNGRWEKQVCGLLCFVKDCERRAYLFQVFDLRRRAIIYEYSVPGTTRLDKCTDLFYTFDGATCRVGINFADRDEAQAFFHHFQRKQEDRRARREQRAQLLNAPEKNGPITPGESRSPKLSHDDKNKSGGLKKFFTVGRKTKIDISAPVRGTFDHRNAIKMDGCFFKDDDCRSLFNTVISEMNITPEEADYVRKKIGNVTDGFADFVTRKQRKAGVHPPTNENDDPSSKSSTATTSSTTRKNPNARRPFQDVAVPTFTHFQTTIVHHAAATSMAPPIPTRTRQNPVASPVSPPGPIPVAPPLPPPGPIPVAPPLPPPGPIPVAPPLPPPGPIRNDLLHYEVAVEKPAAAPGGKAQWLVDIESSKINLKKTPEKSPTPPTPPPVENSKQTMEEYILEFIKIRREALMGKAQSDDEQVEDSDGFGDDFD